MGARIDSVPINIIVDGETHNGSMIYHENLWLQRRLIVFSSSSNSSCCRAKVRFVAYNYIIRVFPFGSTFENLVQFTGVYKQRPCPGENSPTLLLIIDTSSKPMNILSLFLPANNSYD